MNLQQSIAPNGVISPFILELEPVGIKCTRCGSYDTHDDDKPVRMGSKTFTCINCIPCGNQFYKQSKQL